MRSVTIGFAVALALSAPAGYALQEFTLDEARTRIERLEARVALLEAMVAAGHAATPEAQETHIVTGTVVIPSPQHWGLEEHQVGKAGLPCFGDDGFEDIRAGATISVLDEAGTIIATGSLNPGKLVGTDPPPFVCEMSWTIEVPDTEFYVFKIADREGPTFSRADLEAAGWRVPLTIGG
jgi:hypothetical protein